MGQLCKVETETLIACIEVALCRKCAQDDNLPENGEVHGLQRAWWTIFKIEHVVVVGWSVGWVGSALDQSAVLRCFAFVEIEKGRPCRGYCDYLSLQIVCEL